MGALIKPNGALTQLGQDIYQTEKKALGAKNLVEYIEAIIERYKQSGVKYLTRTIFSMFH